MYALRVKLIALLLSALPYSALGATLVKTATVEHARDHTRIIIESDEPIRFTIMALRNPERLLVDLEGVDLNAALTGLTEKIGANHPYLNLTRVSQLRSDVVRLDLNITGEAEPRLETLERRTGQPHRVALDIYPAYPVEIAPPSRLPPAAIATVVDTKPSMEAKTTGEEMWLSFQINRQEPVETVLVLRRDGRLMARGEDLKRWRLRLPEVVPLSHGGEDWYPLDALAGLTFTVDEARQALAMDAPAGLFQGTAINGLSVEHIVPTPSSPGGFFNYDISANHSAGLTNTNALFELGAFNGTGSGIGTFLARDLGHDTRFIRLDTTWTQDRPEQRASLRLGDAISGAGTWGRSVRFGGMQWATNFATQPGLISFPQPGMTGEAVLPSTVDLYVNDALRLRREVPAGPFSIQDIPVVTGQGEARVVVRDLLGRERVVALPYYASPRLLRPGLHDYSYEVGFVRDNYGIASNEYGRFAAVGTHRLGFTDLITGEAHGELLRDHQTVGLASAFLWPAAGLFSASLAGSHNSGGAGALMALGFERQNRTLSFGGNVQITSERFRQLGLETGQIPPRMTGRIFATLATSAYGSLGLSYVQQQYRDRDEVKLVSASYSITLGKLGFLSVSALRSLGTDPKTAIGLNFTRPIGDGASASMSMNRQADSQQAVMQVQRNLPAGSGYGYRLLAAAGEPERREAGLIMQNDIGTYTVEAAQFQGQTGIRGSVTGGVAILGGAPFFSRRIDDSFAMVKIPAYPNVRVYADNQVVAHTNAEGNALLPRLRPYQKNSIRIEQSDLPMDAQIETVQLDAVPYLRSGVLLQFPVKRSRGALLTIVLENGEALPAGATVQIVGGQEDFPVGLRGEVYVTGLLATNRLLVKWRDQSCNIAAQLPLTTEALPHLGTFTCIGVKA